MFGDIQFFDKMTFPGGAMSPNSFLKTHKPQRPKFISFTIGLMTPKTCRIQNSLLMIRSLVNCAIATFLEAENTKYVNLLKNGLTTDQAVT